MSTAHSPMRVSRKAIGEFYARLTNGHRFRCLSNTRHPHLDGTVVTVVGGNTTHLLVEQDGQRRWWAKPERAGDVVELTDSTITYYIDARGHREHTATWHIEPD